MDIRLISVDDYITTVVDNVGTVYQWIKAADTHQGLQDSLIAEGVTVLPGQAANLQAIRNILQLGAEVGLFLALPGQDGTARYYAEEGRFVNLLLANLNGVAVWVEQNPNSLLSQLVADLNVPWEVAERLTSVLSREGKIVRLL